MSADPRHRHKSLLLVLLFLASLVALSPGIGEITGVTAKDEYHLALRTPLDMMEQDEWILPRLDGNLREKPPMISWLTRASFELFGVSLTSARMVNVLFAALLVLVVALIGLECTDDIRYSLCAGLVALSTAGITIQSKFLLYDVPTAAFGGFAFYWFLKWCKAPRKHYLIGVAVCLSAGFLTKGPIGFVIFGSGVLALFITSRDVRSILWRERGALIGTLSLFVALTAPWFVYLYMSYPNESSSVLLREIGGRNIGSFSVIPVIGPAIIALPWTFILVNLLIHPKSLPSDVPKIGSQRTMLILWLGLSVLPFLAIKSFIRYLIGSIIPIALLCALTIESNDPRMIRIHARLGMIITSLLVLFLTGAAWWFKTATSEVGIVLVAWGIFAVVWWQGARLFSMAVVATVLLTTFIGFLYPTLGINAIPPKIFREVEGRPVILYGDQQPGLLPITMGRSLKVTPVVHRSDFSGKGGSALIFAKKEDAAHLEHNLRSLGVDFEQVDSYKTLSSRVSWIRFMREDATRNDWMLALRNRSLEPIKLTIVLYGVKPHAGPEAEIASK